MKTKGQYKGLIEELLAGNAHGNKLDDNLDLLLSWLARPDAENVKKFKDEYTNRNISDEILRGYVLYILEQKLFSQTDAPANEILGLPLDASKEQIKSRYHKLMRIYHPDRGFGDQSVLNSNAEKINQAYKNIINRKIDHKLADRTIKIQESAPRSFEQYKREEVGQNSLTRKLRVKLGSVKQFQFVFFGFFISLCAFVILINFFQSTSIDVGGKKAASGISDSDNNSENEVYPSKLERDETQDTVPNSDLEQVLIGLQQSNTNNPSSETFSDVDSQVQETLVTEKKDEITAKTVSSFSTYIETPEDADINEQKIDPIVPSEEVKEQNQSPSPVEFAEIEKVNIENPQAKKTIKTSSADSKKAVNQNIKQMPAKKKTRIVKPSSENTAPQTSVEQAKLSNVSPDSLSYSNLKSANEQENLSSDRAPVDEIKVVSIVKPKKNYPKANLFERRFAHKFVTRYLESIEKGNIALINDFLSDSLAVNGVSNHKINYLKNTTKMIHDTDKRAYHIKFIGDVVRLGKGHFRVTLRQENNLVFKNSSITQKSSIISYDIKRYSYGSEIVSISDV